MRQLRVGAVFAALLTVMALTVRVQAQDNLLTNGGLEEGEFGPYQGKGRGNLTVPVGWDLWLGQGSTEEGNYYNRGDKTYTFPHGGPEPSPHEGNDTMNMDGGYVQFNAAIFQTVSVSPGTNLVAEGYAYLQVCDFAEGASKCGSDPAKKGQVKIGIDPDGGSDPNASEIIWSDWQDPNDTWKKSKVEATATGGQVTLFFFVTQGEPANRNMAYLDDIKLYAGGEGGENSDEGGEEAPPPTATPQPYVPFVSAQGARDDGSIVHTVREGDTIDSIAVAYGITRQDIADLNPELASLRFLQIGQEILVREAQPTPTPEATEEVSASIPGGVVTEDPEAPEATEAAPRTDGGAVIGGSAEDLNEASLEEMGLEVPDVTGQGGGAGGGGDEGAGTTDDASSGGLLGSLSGAFGGLTGSDAEDGSADADALAAPTNPPPTTPSGTTDGDTETDAAVPATAVVMSASPTPVNRLAEVDITASTASVCVSLFEDANQNRMQESGENLLASAEITLMQEGADIATYQTDGENEPHCFTELEPGEYVAVAAPPAGYGLTTPNQLRLPLTSGTSLNIEFGAAEGVEVAMAPPPDPADDLGNSADEVEPAQIPSLSDNVVAISGIIVAVLAGVVIVAGVGAAILLRRAR